MAFKVHLNLTIQCSFTQILEISYGSFHHLLDHLCAGAAYLLTLTQQISNDMNNLEKKLAAYRAKKAREAKIDAIRAKMKSFLAGLWKTREKSSLEEKVLVPAEDPSDDVSSVCSDDETIRCCGWVDWLIYISFFIMWLIFYIVFIRMGFGTVFLIVSALVFMYVNTRTGPRKKGEVSAYSVFNKDCESIDGTLKAEQFEQEIRYGPSVVK